MISIRRISNIIRYGVGKTALERKRADKAKARSDVFDSELWGREDGLAKRSYASYDAYVEHQVAKLDKVEHRLKETQTEDYNDFVRRFEGCTQLNEARNVLCLGARLGTEVQAMVSLGYFAVGIDLNPGDKNEYVLAGDFHHIVFADESVDAIYTNVLDHVFDLEKMLAEVSRLLKPGGLLVADILQGYEEGFVPGKYEATHWPTIQALLDKMTAASSFNIEEKRDLGYVRRDHWTQVVFRKPAAH